MLDQFKTIVSRLNLLTLFICLLLLPMVIGCVLITGVDRIASKVIK